MAVDSSIRAKEFRIRFAPEGKVLHILDTNGIDCTQEFLDAINSGESTAMTAAISAAIATEVTARNSAISTAVAGEATARDLAIAAEATARTTAIGAEATARDTAIAAQHTTDLTVFTHWDGTDLTQNGSPISGIGKQDYQFKVSAYGAVGDVKVVTDGAMTNGSATLACNTSTPFTSADVGKAICVPLAKNANSDLQAIITGFTDSAHVTLSVAATATVSNARLIYGTDDTAAIASCVAAAVAYAKTTAGNGRAEVLFDNKKYMLAADPTAGASGVCKAQIPLDMVSTPAKKVTLVLKGPQTATHLYHWLQTTPQMGGATLCTIYTPGTNGGTARNQRSVIGGPIPSLGGAGVFSNMHIVVDGITISTPVNSQIAGFDFRMIAEATIESAAVLARSNVTGAPTIPNLALGGISDFAFGCWMPMTGNNALCDVKSFSAEGMVYGFVAEEHCQVSSLRVVNNYDGLVIWPSGGGAHGNTFNYVCAENNVIQVLLAGGYPQVDIQCLDIEQTGSPQNCIKDIATTTATGKINILTNGTSASMLSVLNNATYKPSTTGIRVYDASGIQGARTAPAIPTSAADFQNPFWRDCAVAISGGTVSDISIDGVSQGLTSGVFFLPTGKNIKLTYTVAPTWAWTAL